MWSLSQTTGCFALDKKTIAFGYSGRGAGKNNPLMQEVHDIGPLPRGRYIGAAPVDHPVLGKGVIPLVPEHGTEMFGRSGFFLHSDNPAHPGESSHGCPVLKAAIIEAFWLSGDHHLEVTA